MIRTAAWRLAMAIALVLALVAGAGPGRAGSTAATERVAASLVAETASAAPGRSIWVALRLNIAEGWHTYWRNPGDSGEPTRIEWRLPDGVEASEIRWPAPEAIPYGPLVNFGYHGTAWHLAELSLPGDWPADRPLEIGATASWLVCKDICIPEGAELSLRLPPANVSVPASAEAAGLAAARQRLPAVHAGGATFAPAAGTDKQIVLSLDPAAAAGEATAAYFFPDTWGVIEAAAPQRLERRGDAVLLTMAAGDAAPGPSLRGVLVFDPGRHPDDPARRALSIDTGRVEAGTPSSTGSTGADEATAGGGGANPGLIVALSLALLGGLTLNVMPCVFPVLSIKAMGVLRHASDRRALRLSGLSYTAGVLVFIGLVAIALLALKAAGEGVGWGFQLQSPAFVAVMALVVFALGLSLSGVFTIGETVMGWGGSVAGPRSGRGSSFLTGALAALVATPCTAPFMGVALGFALTQPWPTALAVFMALGLGLALPYLALTFVPGLAGRLPRPGPWMERVKQALAFPLYVTAAWLVWVLSLQAGAGAVFAVLVGMIFCAFAAWLFDISRTLEGARRGLAGAASAVAVLAALAIVLRPLPAAAPLPDSGAEPVAAAVAAEARLAAEPFSFARLDELRGRGVPVFVNVTAAWCITCQVNERIALSSERVARASGERGIVYLKGDWTNRDPEITRLLDSFGRSGVPLYLFYGPDEDRPVILPQFLTESIVTDVIGRVPAVAEDLNRAKGSG